MAYSDRVMQHHCSEGSGSFLEKRTKRLLLFKGLMLIQAALRIARFFASFFKKQRFLALVRLA
jgi:hypothetical protein